MVASSHQSSAPSPAQLHARFLSILRRIRLHAEISFRGVRCPDLRADKVAEAVALAWKWFRRLAERGRDAADFPAAARRRGRP